MISIARRGGAEYACSWEVTSKADVYEAYKAYKAFLLDA